MRRILSYCLATFTFATFLATSPVQAQKVIKKIQPSQLVTNGESFFQASNITSELTRLARRDGYIAASESFKTIAVSGQPLATIINQYKSCTPKPTYLISDGAGIDLMSSSDIAGLSAKLKTYLDEMKKGGTKKLLWMIYPDPQGGSWATLKKNQDLWAQAVPPIINACTEPKTLLIDLRPVWAGKYSQYTSDGIHATNAGGTATAEAFWKLMIDSCFFDLEPTSIQKPKNVTNTAQSAIKSQVSNNNTVKVSLSVEKQSNVSFKLTTVSGRSVFTADRHVSGTGLQTLDFPLSGIASGVYCCVVQAGNMKSQSTIMVP